MDKLLEILYKRGVGDLIDISRNKLMQKDTTYQHDLKDLLELEERYEQLEISFDHRIMIGDYIACMQTVQARACDLSYMAGMKDAITLFHSLDLIREPEI